MKKKLLKIILCYFVIGAFTTALAFVSFFGILRDLKSESVSNAAEYLLSNIPDIDDVQDDMELRNLIQVYGLSYTMTSSVVENVLVFDSENNLLTGDVTDTSDSIKIDFSKNRVYVTGDYIYTPYSLSDSKTVWFENSASEFLDAFAEFAKQYILIFPIGFIALCLITIAVLRFSKENKKALWVLYFSIFVLTIGMYMILTQGMIRVEDKYSDDDVSRRLASIEYGVQMNSSLSDEDAEFILSNLSDEDLEYVESHSNGNLRLAVLYAVNCFDEKFDSYNLDITLKDNIWDQSVPISDRVNVNFDYEEFFRDTLDYFLQSVMLGILATILLIDILSYDKEKRFSSVGNQIPIQELPKDLLPILENSDKMKLFLTVCSFADTLIIVIIVSMLKDFLVSDYGDKINGYLSLIITVASFLGCLTIFEVPRLIKRCGNVITYTRVSLALCALGAFACFMAKSSTLFIIGYMLLTLGGGFMRMVMILFTMAHPTEKEGLFFLANVNRAPITGQILGAVIGAILIVIINKTQMYLVSGVIYVLMAIFTFTFNPETLTNALPEKTDIVNVIKIKEIRSFCGLIMVPFGFQNYFFTFVVPLSASALGLSTLVVNFIYLLRNVCKLFFKANKKTKQIWRTLPLKTSSVLCMVISAALFFIYLVFNNVWGLIFISVGLAYVQAALNSRTYAYNYSLLGNDFDRTFGNSATIILGRRVGKTIAPILAQTMGAVSLPMVMLFGAVAYLLSGKEPKKS